MNTYTKLKPLLFSLLGLFLLASCVQSSSDTPTHETDQPTTTPSSSESTEETQEATSVPEENTYTVSSTIENLELPELRENETYISHTGYSFSYNEQHEQANWVAYELTSTEVQGTEERKDRFKADPDVESGSATTSDYKKSGYDRGHLAPAADMKWSETAMLESFYFSNMSPQKPGFNRGIWKELEAQVREWASEDGTLYVVTGGVLEDGLETIGKNEVSIPKYYYKVILDYNEPEIKAIAFLMPNEKTDKEISDFVVPINKIEELTGINFFYQLEDIVEEELESSSEIAVW